MSDFAKFVGKYAAEALSVASALGTILEGLALSPAQNAKVQLVIDKLETAAENLVGYKDTTPAVKIAKSDIEKAVAAALPAILADSVTKAVVEALAAEKAKDATSDA